MTGVKVSHGLCLLMSAPPPGPSLSSCFMPICRLNSFSHTSCNSYCKYIDSSRRYLTKMIVKSHILRLSLCDNDLKRFKPQCALKVVVKTLRIRFLSSPHREGNLSYNEHWIQCACGTDEEAYCLTVFL